MSNPPPPGWNPPAGPWQPGQPGGPGGMPPAQGGFGPPPGPSTPPPFGPPPGSTTPPPFGMPGGMPGAAPPPRRSSSGPIIAAIVGGGLVLLIILATVLYVVVKPSEKTPTEKLAAAAKSLSTARALSVRGTVGSASNSLQGDLKVTSGGRATGPVNWDGDNVTLLSTDGNLFVKADNSYWTKQLRYSTTPTYLSGSGQRWGKLASYKLTFNFKDYLTPSAIATKMRQVGKYSVRTTTKSTAQGRPAVKISTYSATYYLSDEDDPKLLRLESTYPAIAADITPQSGSDAAATVTELRSNIGALRDSLDTTKIARVQEVKEGACNVSGCTVRARVYATGSAGAPSQLTVFVWITADTKTGRRLGTCTTTATTSGLESTWAQCRVTGSTWSSFRGGTGYRRWWMQADTVATGVTTSEISTMQAALDRE